MMKLLVICGPTATGKTQLGISMAKQFNGEIVSADSRQVYQGMDIITGKGLFPKTRLKSQNYTVGHHLLKGIPLWLTDVVRPDQEFSVALYAKFAKTVIQNILSRRKLPVIVGGSGLYIKSLVESIETIGIPPNKQLRQKLNRLTVEQLRAKLKQINPAKLSSMNNSDRNNPRRLVRAIEIGNKQEDSKFVSKRNKVQINNYLTLGLRTVGYKELYKKIDQRVQERVEQGAEKEVKKLLKKYTWDNSVLGVTIGYQEWREFTQGKISKEIAIKRWKFAEHAYARRQITWFKKKEGIQWLDIGHKDFDKQAINIVQKWYETN